MRTILIALAMTACSPSKVEKIQPGSSSKLSFNDYLASLQAAFGATGKGKVQPYTDIVGGLLITANQAGVCADIKPLLMPGGGAEMPDGTYVTCREGDAVRWELDRR